VNSKPTIEELANRIARQLEAGGNTSAVVMIWKGYLAGLYEWGAIDLASYSQLEDTLPAGGDVEITELFLGQPISPEMRAEVESVAAKRGS
jgi:hypothetical protein